MSETLIYHLARAKEWQAAEAAGVYRGSPEDRRDGFLHFSTSAAIKQSAAKHRAGEADLLLVEVNAEPLAADIKWEGSASRGAILFPHLYGDLPLSAVTRIAPLPLDEATGLHIFPDWF
ncbi:DUF952 domain-containing protein [Lacibacterium aquatile]|uniref:DUF952 domain-containing protein n=1 Tax=Lacibacterium aquatile TaxID=1168082 RepID=A0ABW5DSV8_9PROT